MKSVRIISLIMVAFAVAAFSASADDATNAPATISAMDATKGAAPLVEGPDADPWQFNATPYMWAVQLNGKVKTLGREANVGISFDQIFNHLEGPPLMLNLEVRKKNFGFYTAPLYVKLSADANNAGPITVVGGNDTMTLWIVESGGFYQIAKWGEDKPLTLEALAGVRFWNFNNSLSLNGPTSQFNTSRDKDLWDPFVGLRLEKHLTEKLSFSMTGEFGGFAISQSTPNDSWQAVGTLNYDFTKRFTFKAGYRALGLNTYNLTGQGDVRANLILQGAVIGLEFRF
jgi:hypothetical protein